MKVTYPVKKPATLPVRLASMPTAASASGQASPRTRHGRRLAQALAAATVPVLLLAGCLPGSDSDDGGDDGDKASSAPESSSAPSPAPVKFKSLPDPCTSIAKKTIKASVPGAKKSGKKLKSANQDRYNGCLWTGLQDYDYRSLTISFHRFDSETATTSGDKRARQHAAQQQDAVAANDAHKDVKESKLSGVGDKATGISYDTTKKNAKKSEDYREHRVVVLSSNVVITVDYSAAGFEDAKKPSADTVRKAAEKVAKESLTAVK